MLLLRGPQVFGVVPVIGNSAAPATVGGQYVTLADRKLQLTTDGRSFAFSKEYTSMERYRTDFGSLEGRYIMLHPRPNPYDLRYEPGNSVVKTLRPNHSGNCIRVLGGNPGPEQAILIHEAPNVTWLIGCISPRPKDDKREFDNADGNPSFRAMNEIMGELNAQEAAAAPFLLLSDPVAYPAFRQDRFNVRTPRRITQCGLDSVPARRPSLPAGHAFRE